MERVVERVREWRKCLLLLLLLIKKCVEKGALSPFTTKYTLAREGRGRFRGWRSRSIGSTDQDIVGGALVTFARKRRKCLGCRGVQVIRPSTHSATTISVW